MRAVVALCLAVTLAGCESSAGTAGGRLTASIPVDGLLTFGE